MSNNIIVGEYTYGRPNIIGHEYNVIIGKFCSIAGNVKIYAGHYHNTKFISTYPFNASISLYNGQCITFKNGQGISGHPCGKGDVIIGNDVWLGNDCSIMSGVKIGDGAVVAANAVVVHDVPPYAIVCGNPGQIKKYRFSQDVIDKLCNFKWWNLDIQTIEKLIPMLMSTDEKRFCDIIDNFNKEKYK